MEKIGKILETLGKMIVEFQLNLRHKDLVMLMQQLNLILMEAEMKLMEKKNLEQQVDTKVRGKKKETKENGEELERTNLIKAKIGLILIILWEVLILKHGEKVVSKV